MVAFGFRFGCFGVWRLVWMFLCCLGYGCWFYLFRRLWRSCLFGVTVVFVWLLI